MTVVRLCVEAGKCSTDRNCLAGTDLTGHNDRGRVRPRTR